MASLPRSLRSGLWLLGLLAGLALAAPLLATDRPWLARGERGLAMPALARLLGGEARADAAAETLLAAPIPHDPRRLDLDATLEPPSWRHPMGTDVLGRDVAARMVHGARVSLKVGLLAALFALAVGVPLGAVAGYRGGATDAAVSRTVEAVLCFPALLLALALLATAPAWLRGLPDATRVALVLGATGWTPVARYLRAEFLKLREAEMVQAARAAGGADARIIVRHILPCAMAPVLVTAAFTVGAAIAMEASLSFLGLGVRPPVPSWGGMLFDARARVDTAWWLALFPGAALFLALTACNLIGEGVRDLLDPRGRARAGGRGP